MAPSAPSRRSVYVRDGQGAVPNGLPVERLLLAAATGTSDVVLVVGRDRAVRYASAPMATQFGYEPAAMVGRSLSWLVHADHAAKFDAVLTQAERRPGVSQRIEFGLWHAQERWVATEAIVTSMLDDPSVQGIVLNVRDVSDRRDLEAALRHQAFHDALTGLANRVLFTERVAHAVTTNPGEGSVAVLFCDLDGFKSVNDTQGHAIGDKLLCLVAERITRCVRASDTVARLGGDEFAVLLEGPAVAASADVIADTIFQAVAEPYFLDGREVTIGVSIGIAVASGVADTADGLLRNADLAMYKSKVSRPHRWVHFESQMHAALLDRVQLVGELRHAQARHELTVYYQPTVELSDGRIVGTEALLRWHHPRRGELGPDHFVGLAEDNGLITEIGEWVLRETCQQAARWQRWAPADSLFSMAVNISARQLTPDLVQVVRSAVDAAGLPPAALMLEITESVLIERTGDMMTLMQQLKSFGVRLALDDFGTGYSSLSYLSRFPVDCLKIDRSFVKALGGPSSETELARTILRLSESLGLATIAQGIETPAQFAALRDMGCRYGQGFIFARPLPPQGIEELVGTRLFAHASPVPMSATYEVAPQQSSVQLPR